MTPKDFDAACRVFSETNKALGCMVLSKTQRAKILRDRRMALDVILDYALERGLAVMVPAIREEESV